MNDDAANREGIRDADGRGSDAAADAVAAVPASASPGFRPPRPGPAGNPLRVALLVTLLAVALLAAWYARVYAKRAALLRIQQACLSHAPPAELVVYEENPERAAELLARGSGGGGEYVSLQTGEPAGPKVAGYVPAAWREMRRWAMPGNAEPQGAVLFLHERQTQLGKRLLVCVEADRENRRLRITFIHPGATTLDPTPVMDVDLAPLPQEGLVILSSGGDPFAGKLPPPDADPAARADLQFLAGRPDGSDPARFHLPYRAAGRSGEFDMWVGDERTVYFVDRMYAK